MLLPSSWSPLRADRVERRLHGAERGERQDASLRFQGALGVLDGLHQRVAAVRDSERGSGPRHGVVARAQRRRRVVDELVAVRGEDRARELFAREDHLERRRDTSSVAGDQRVVLAFESPDHTFQIPQRTLRPGAERVCAHRLQLALVPQEPVEEVARALFRHAGRETVTDAEPPGLVVHELGVHPRRSRHRGADVASHVEADLSDGLEGVVLLLADHLRAPLHGPDDEHHPVCVATLPLVFRILDLHEEFPDLTGELSSGTDELLELRDVLAVLLEADGRREVGVEGVLERVVRERHQATKGLHVREHSDGGVIHGARHAEHVRGESRHDQADVVGARTVRAEGDPGLVPEDLLVVESSEDLDDVAGLVTGLDAPDRAFADLRCGDVEHLADLSVPFLRLALVVDVQEERDERDAGGEAEERVAEEFGGADHGVFRSWCGTGTGVPAQEYGPTSSLTSIRYLATICAFFNYPYAIAVIPKLTFKGSPTPLPPRPQATAGCGVRKV